MLVYYILMIIMNDNFFKTIENEKCIKKIKD